MSVSLRAASASYGGGSEVLVLESNQNHAMVKDTEVCPTLPASMGLGLVTNGTNYGDRTGKRRNSAGGGVPNIDG